MAESKSLNALVRGVKQLWPRATVWTKGDLVHQGSASDHNDDDTPGSKPEQTDADSKPERRAADIPLLGGVTMDDLDTLRARLTGRAANRARLRYVILRQTIWRKRGGWVAERYTGDYHEHLHASVDVADDDNGEPWDIGPGAPQQVEARRARMFLMHKVVQGVAVFALVGESTVREWKATDVMQTSAGPIDGQDLANAFAQGLGDSKVKTPAQFEAIKATVTS